MPVTTAKAIQPDGFISHPVTFISWSPLEFLKVAPASQRKLVSGKEGNKPLRVLLLEENSIQAVSLLSLWVTRTDILDR